MVTTNCDKCGVRISRNPVANISLPQFNILIRDNYMTGWQSVDLCSKCEKSDLNGYAAKRKRRRKMMTDNQSASGGKKGERNAKNIDSLRREPNGMQGVS